MQNNTDLKKNELQKHLILHFWIRHHTLNEGASISNFYIYIYKIIKLNKNP